MAESTRLEKQEAGKKDNQCRYFKMKVLQANKKKEVNEFVSGKLDGKCVVFSD